MEPLSTLCEPVVHYQPWHASEIALVARHERKAVNNSSGGQQRVNGALGFSPGPLQRGRYLPAALGNTLGDFEPMHHRYNFRLQPLPKNFCISPAAGTKPELVSRHFGRKQPGIEVSLDLGDDASVGRRPHNLAEDVRIE
jgi:hypothetical protein